MLYYAHSKQWFINSFKETAAFYTVRTAHLNYFTGIKNKHWRWRSDLLPFQFMVGEGSLKSFAKNLLKNFVYLAFLRKMGKSFSWEGKSRKTLQSSSWEILNVKKEILNEKKKWVWANNFHSICLNGKNKQWRGICLAKMPDKHRSSANFLTFWLSSVRVKKRLSENYRGLPLK